jgi:NAD(P)-dependent dehydrogenase (short-subunit alcohol dehydrogenase family)
VFVGSTTGSVGFPGCSAYTATKGAVAAVSRALAVELAPKGIRVNIVVPGYVRTPMLQPHLDANAGYEDWIVANTPLGRIDGPENLAPTIVFLLSPLSAYIDGQTFIVDGGWTAR